MAAAALTIAAAAVVMVAADDDVPRFECRRPPIELSGTVHSRTSLGPAWVVVWHHRNRHVARVDADGRWTLQVPFDLRYRITATRRSPWSPGWQPPVAAAEIGTRGLGAIALTFAEDDKELRPSLPRSTPAEPRTVIEGRVRGIASQPVTFIVSDAGDRVLAHRIIVPTAGRYRIEVRGVPEDITAVRWPISDGARIPRPSSHLDIDLDLVERPTSTVFGTLRDRDGNPLADIDLEVGHRGDLLNGPRRSNAIGTRGDVPGTTRTRTRTGADGRFALTARADGIIVIHDDGAYEVQLRGHGPGPWRHDLDMRHAALTSSDCGFRASHDWFPEVDDAELAALTSLAADRARQHVLDQLPLLNRL